MSSASNFTIVKGTDVILIVPVKTINNETGTTTATDVAGSYFYFQIYEKDGTTLVIAKDNDPLGVDVGITLRVPTTDGIVEVAFDHPDLTAVAAGAYPYVAFIRLDPTGVDDRYQVATGTVHIVDTLAVIP